MYKESLNNSWQGNLAERQEVKFSYKVLTLIFLFISFHFIFYLSPEVKPSVLIKNCHHFFFYVSCVFQYVYHFMHAIQGMHLLSLYMHVGHKTTTFTVNSFLFWVLNWTVKLFSIYCVMGFPCKDCSLAIEVKGKKLYREMEIPLLIDNKCWSHFLWFFS